MSALAAPGGEAPGGTAPGAEARAARSERLRLLARSPGVVVGALVVLFWVVCAILGGHITPHDPIFDQSPSIYARPSGSYWFGTDRLGRDVFSRVLAGSRDILVVAPLATLLGTALGTALGLITGYLRGYVDDVLSRIIEAVLALPIIIIAVTAVAAIGSRSRWTVVVVIGLVFGMIIARTVRAAVLAERELDYVEAARLRGEKPPYIMFVELLPNVMNVILVEATVRLGYAIFVVASLTFIGFGVQPPSPDWAAQIFDNYQFLDPYWWTVLFPAAAIASLVISVNLVSDGIQQVYER
jgi:peptide/nickel transport system permease protein